jgi:hypothetical protein
MIEQKIYGVSVLRDNPKTGEYIVRSMHDQKKLLSAIATDMLKGNKKARTLANNIQKCRIRITNF